ncbi:MAG: glycosyltransferase, partial [Planctomycetota bacterium]|nr:glycosyltransferase [Planctomycetota bacterium]
MTRPRVSVCLPTWNAEADLERLLPALDRQRLEGGWELVVIDSDSRDCTRQLLRARGASVTWIPQAEFRHGATRNRLAGLAAGEVLVFLSQDARPVDADFLARLIEPLGAEVVGATARVLPNPGDDPLTARTVLQAPEAGDTPGPLLTRGPGPRFNNVASAILPEALAETPFPDVPFGEDAAWAEAIEARGQRLVFQPSAVVHHAHRYGPAAAFERYRVDAAFLRGHGVHVRPNLASVLKGIAHELRADWRHVREHGGWGALWRAPKLRTA